MSLLRFFYHLAEETQGLHWGLLFCLFLASLGTWCVYIMLSSQGRRFERSIVSRNVALGIVAASSIVVILDFTLLRRQGYHIAEALDLQAFSWLADPVDTWFKPLLLDTFNIALFIPAACALSCLWASNGRLISWWVPMLTLVALSIGVEAAQMYWGLGTPQLEDIVCNALGTVIGSMASRSVARELD